MDLLKDYDMEVKYHPRKVNAVAEDLRTKFTSSIASLFARERRILREFDTLQIEVVIPGDRGYIAPL